MTHNILIIAGEPSGDMRASELLKELRPLMPDVHFWGTGGDSMLRENVELIEHICNLSMVGVWEVLKKLHLVRRQLSELKKEIKKRKPDFAILVDYPGFNLKMAEYLKKNGIPVVYFIIPQVWAWGSHRIKALEKFVDLALVLFPFEEKLLKQHNVNCSFVGHPIMEMTDAAAPADARFPGEGPVVALLPGSRKHEVHNMLPVMLEAAEKITVSLPSAKFTLAKNSNIDPHLYEDITKAHPSLNITSFSNDTVASLKPSDFAIVTSGTATLEAAIMEKPLVIVYKASPLTYVLFKIVATVPFLGLVNIIAGREIVPELLQKDLNAETLSGVVVDTLKNPSRIKQIKEDLRSVKLSLGEKGAAARAAQTIKSFAEKQGL